MSLPELSRSRGLNFCSCRLWILVVLLALISSHLTLQIVAQESSLAAIDELIRQSKLDEADKQLQAILQKQPSNARAEMMLGIVRRKQSNWIEAEALFRRAFSGNPRSLDACENLATLLPPSWPPFTKKMGSMRSL
jgi:cytochrome c-type biogenesis protein CcmH/NrfG